MAWGGPCGTEALARRAAEEKVRSVLPGYKLYHAARSGNTEDVRRLLQANADIEHKEPQVRHHPPRARAAPPPALAGPSGMDFSVSGPPPAPSEDAGPGPHKIKYSPPAPPAARGAEWECGGERGWVWGTKVGEKHITKRPDA